MWNRGTGIRPALQLRYMVTVMPLVIVVSVVGMDRFFRTAFLNRKLRLFPAEKNKRSKWIIGEVRMILH